MARLAIENPSNFWRDKASYITWFKAPEKILEGDPPKDKWFPGGITNISYNAVDRHLPKLRNKVAFYWVNENLDYKKEIS